MIYEYDLERANTRIRRLSFIIRQWERLHDRRMKASKKLAKEAFDLICAANDFLADFGTYINEDDYDLPDSTSLEQAVTSAKIALKQLKLELKGKPE